MKVALDIDKLLAEGRISGAEYTKLKESAAEETGSLAFNVLIGFGVIATAVGAVALSPSFPTATFAGLVLSAIGIWLGISHSKKWGLLGSMLLLVGSVTAAGGIVMWDRAHVGGFLIVTILFIVAGILARSGLLAAMAAITLSATIGAATSYDRAEYDLIIKQPLLTVALFSALAWAAYQLSLRLPPHYQRLAVIFSRTCVLLVNFGFWVGSFWGDSLGRQKYIFASSNHQMIPDWAFVIGWAVALAAIGVWAVRRNRRWMVNVLAVFASIHFYTQYFERLGRSPTVILCSGLFALAIALAIVRYNKVSKTVSTV